MPKQWNPEAQNFAQFKEAIKRELNSKPADSEWLVRIHVKKSGNPIHEYRIELTPAP